MSATVIHDDWNLTAHCSPCFYGSTCQFTTSYYSISLEAFLFAHLQPKRITVIIIVTSLISTVGNILSIATFCQATSREMGSGIYRLWITVVGQLGTMTFAIRLLVITNQRNTGIIDCFGLDYLISVLPSLYYSLTACLAVERVFVAYKNLSFSKERSRHAAKIVIPILILYHFLIALPKPFHRQLFADSHVSHRTWCVLHFQTPLFSTFEIITNIIHLFLPIIVNLFGTIAMLIILVKHKVALQQNASIWLNLGDVVSTYRHNIISSCMLVVSATHHLVIVSRLNCVTRSWENTIYLISYAVYLVPLMTSFFIFVLLSAKYRAELDRLYQRLVRYISLRRY
jgi:hypothetical protein